MAWLVAMFFLSILVSSGLPSPFAVSTEATFARGLAPNFTATVLAQQLSGRMSFRERLRLRDHTRSMFFHAFDKYLEFGFPFEELCPLSCRGRGVGSPDVAHRGDLDDVFAGYPLTLVDSLEALLVLRAYDRFERALHLVRSTVRFDGANHTVSLFETTIRTLGGLLSAHQLAERAVERGLLPSRAYDDGFLLALARDLGDRLMPAFDSPTGIPWSRVNLMDGVPAAERRHNKQCTAGAGSLTLEFGLLSALTGEPRYWRAVRRCAEALYARRSPLNLFGGSLDVRSGRWLDDRASVGAGSDSFYEYLFKGHVLSGDPGLLTMFNAAYGAVERHLRAPGGWYVDARRSDGAPLHQHTQALAAFWPALQVLVGDVNDAETSFDHFLGVWRLFGFLPEAVGDAGVGPVRLLGPAYPLRPELFESAFFLSQATGDHEYLFAGRELLASLDRARVPCGFAAVADVRHGRLEDRLDSFFFSETLKYAYLLFDPEPSHPLLGGGESVLFTTEGHPILLDAQEIVDWQRRLRTASASTSTERALSALPPSSLSSSLSPPPPPGPMAGVGNLCECGCGAPIHAHQDELRSPLLEYNALAETFSTPYLLGAPAGDAGRLFTHSHTRCPGLGVREETAALSFATLAALMANQSVAWHWSRRRVLRQLRRHALRQLHWTAAVDRGASQPPAAPGPELAVHTRPSERPRVFRKVQLTFFAVRPPHTLTFEAANQSLFITEAVGAQFGPPPGVRICGPPVFAGQLCNERADFSFARDPEPPFVLADRGGCLFWDKARRAAAPPFEARALVVVNHRDGGGGRPFVMTSGGTDALDAAAPPSVMIGPVPDVVRRKVQRICLSAAQASPDPEDAHYQVSLQFVEGNGALPPPVLSQRQVVQLVERVQTNVLPKHPDLAEFLAGRTTIVIVVDVDFDF